MSRPITRSTLRNSVFLTMALGLLAGCDESGQFVAMQAFKPNTQTEGTPEPGAPIKTVERDVEAPDVFSANEAGLWDGRPSLGGVWVAHPDVTEPERVIIRNSDNDKFVVGALFRRERDIPGPRLQISSDAAEALGMLAGAPAELNVTALRKEEVSVEPEVAPLETEAVAAPAEITATPLDPIESAAAAIDAPAPVIQPAAAATPEPIPVAAAAPARAATSGLSKPFIQIGIFSVEANATRTAKQMRSAGIIPTVKTFDRDGKPFWRVVVGPAATSDERSDLLAKIKTEGFTDAYAVSN
ncbi:SPOR domain-containing protein [Tateyamaria armeniaca]|uniref:SPOR domain-containing protein n=1 Tax=Tateyamaria armeniaca TaxID=2518930 RepID=A0ABW8V120_9RHOB